jgi:hypothetical protein
VTDLGSPRLAAGSAERMPGGRGAAVAAIVVAAVAAAGLRLIDDAPLRLGAALVAVGVVLASALARAWSEVARRRSHAPALKPYREHRALDVPTEPTAAVSVVEQELGDAGFLVERVESSRGSRVVLASRAGVPFAGSMTAHLGLALAIAALAVGSPEQVGAALALGALAVVVGIALRVAYDPQVVWCAAQAKEGGTALELVVSGSILPSLVARCSGRLAERIGLRFLAAPAPAPTAAPGPAAEPALAPALANATPLRAAGDVSPEP